jgi:nucleotide-binding universal stress UspA family protein
MYRSILVPLDGSRLAEQALPLALALARRAKATLHVVSVHVPMTPIFAEGMAGFESTFDATIRQRSQTYLDQVLARLAQVSKVPVTATLVEGAVAEAVHGKATASGADLVVMTTHGRGPLARAWLGSVADELVRRLPVPVLLVRPADAPLDLNREPELRHLLIPLDGSPFAEQIIGPAVALASLMETDVTLVRVIQPLVIGYTPPVPPPATGSEFSVLAELQTLHEEEKARAQKYLDHMAERLRGQSLRVQTRVIVHDQPAVAILGEAKTHPFDLIALETHGRSGLPRLFLGSIADKVVRGASLPVLVHRPAH